MKDGQRTFKSPKTDFAAAAVSSLSQSALQTSPIRWQQFCISQDPPLTSITVPTADMAHRPSAALLNAFPLIVLTLSAMLLSTNFKSKTVDIMQLPIARLVARAISSHPQVIKVCKRMGHMLSLRQKVV